ncbi:helix-turn-helix domain-containing protein [Candidatus Sumerlaeota bacterium]|nr:helix-turn-helix domain-containing protein [Candidatus Sumerlaeota bacterium]
MAKTVTKAAAKKPRAPKSRGAEKIALPNGSSITIWHFDLPDQITVVSSPGVFRKVRLSYGLTQQKMSSLTGTSLRKLSALERGEQRATFEDLRRFTELCRLRKELVHIVAPEAISNWLQEPNEFLDGQSPVEIIRRGESDKLWRLIWRLQDGVPLD